MRSVGAMRFLLARLCAPWLVTASCWIALTACLDSPFDASPSPSLSPATARLVVAWDPLACGEPHRVVVELEDDTGAARSASVPCNLGGLTVDLPHLGVYRGRIYAWALAAPIRSVMPLEVMIDEPIVQWHVATPR
jgi:hypothetical protein